MCITLETHVCGTHPPYIRRIGLAWRYGGQDTTARVVGCGNPFEAEKPATKLQMAWLDIKDFITDTWALVKHGFSQADKRKHFTIGMAIAFVCGLAWMLIGLPLPGLFAFLVGACAGIVKEWWDSKGHGTVEVMDFVFTAMGSFLAMIAIVVINLII